MTAAECGAAYLKALQDLNTCLELFTQVVSAPPISAERADELENKRKAAGLNPFENFELISYWAHRIQGLVDYKDLVAAEKDALKFCVQTAYQKLDVLRFSCQASTPQLFSLEANCDWRKAING